MKTLLQKSILVSFLTLFLGLNQQISAQLYFRGTSATWTSSVWSTTNAAPYTTAWTTSSAAVFNVASSAITGATTNVSSITANEDVTVTAGGTMGTNGTVATITVASGKTFNFAGQSLSTAAGTGFIKAGAGTLICGNGNLYPGGFTMNAGTFIVGGVNSMGGGGALNINGGTLAASSTRTIPAAKYSGVNIGGDFTFGNSTNAANISIADNASLGASSSRTITLGSTGTYTLGGVISGSGSNLTVAATAAGVLVLTGQSTYNGTTSVSGGTLRLNRTGGTTLPTGNSVVVNSGGTLTISTAQQLNNVTVDAGGTLILNATLTVSGTATINGTLQIGQGGFATTTGGGSYTYGSNGTLAYNLTSATYGPVDAGHVYWPATNGPVNVTMTGISTAAVNMGVARTVPGTFLLVSGTNMVKGTALTLTGTTQINGGNFQTTPTYGSASTLIYNVTYGTWNEWTGGASTSVAAGSGIPANVQVLSGTLTLGGGRGVPGNVTVSSGAGMILNATSGDLYIGGNLTHSGSTWTNNTRAVVFVGTGTSVINTSANSGVQFFDYFLVNKSSGSVQIGSTTNVTLNTTAGSVLQFLDAGTLDLNGRTLTMNNNGGSILVNGTTGGASKSIVSTSGTGTIAITNNKSVTSSASGTLTTDSNVNWILTGGINFGGVSTVNGILQINAGGFVTTNAPIYGTGSLLRYNSAAVPFNRTTEWSASSGAGYPYNVQISNNTTLSPGGTGNTGTALNVANNLTIDSGSAIYMDYGANNMTVPLTVNNDLILSGSLSASGAAGGDIIVRGNWNKTGSFFPNARAVFFQGMNAQTFTGATTFDYVLIDKTAGSFTLNNDFTSNQTLTFTATNTVNITTGSNKVIISNTGSVARTGSGHVYGNLQKNIPTGTNSRTFEVGDASVYAPVITAYTGVTGAGDITVNTTVNDHPQIATSTINAAKSVNRFYTITNSGVTGGSYDGTFTFVSGDVDSGAITANFIVNNYVNPTWSTTTTGTRTSTTTQATGLTVYGDFQLGEPAPVTTTWTAGASTTVWTTAGNWSNGVPTASDNAIIATASFYPEITTTETVNALTINTGTSLKIVSGNNLTVVDVVDNDGTLTIENNANLKQDNDVTNTGAGSTVVHRNTDTLMRQDYVLWSSPVDGQQLQAFSPLTLSTRFYIYDPTLGSAGLYATTSPTANFVTGIGYLIRLPNNHPATPQIWNGVFTGGNANNGTIPLNSLSSSTYYAIGNPYPSTIDADSFIAGNSLTDAMYFWRKTNNSANPSYATYTLAGGVGTAGSGDPLGLVPNGVIQVGQGFIVRTGAAANSLQFTNGMRITDNSDLFFRRSQTERNRIWLNLNSDSGVFCQTLVSYMENATSGVDNTIDGRYFNDSQNALTSLINNEEYAIQGRALPFDAADIVPLGFKSVLAGNYNIAIDHVDGFFTDSEAIYLKDNLTNTIHDLRLAPYTFSTEAGVFNTRFELRYNNLLAVSQPSFTVNNVVVYKQNQELVINAGKTEISKVQVYDVRGRLLVEKTNVNATELHMNPGVSNQVLLVKITSITNEIVIKKVVN